MPTQNQAPLPTEHVEVHASSGPMIGIAIIVALLAFGGYYFYTTQLPQAPAPLPVVENTVPATADTWQAPATTSDAPQDIQAEIDATDMAQFEAQMDADLAAVEAAL